MNSPTHHHHDVVVVGGRVAGATTAMLLARAGLDVAVVDRSVLPSDTTSTHSLVRGGVVQLARFGLLDDVLASGAPAIRTVTFHQGSGPSVTLPVKERAGVDLMLAPRRYVLDDILAEHAVAAGAVLADRTSAGRVVRDDTGRVTGVLTTGPDGWPEVWHARLVVGADGVRSRMADRVGAVVRERHIPSGACFYTYVADVDWSGFEFHLAEGAFAGVFPTHHGEAAVWLMLPHTRAAKSVLRAGDRKLEAWLGLLDAFAPRLADRVRGGTVRAPLRGTLGLPNQVRQAAGPGWALVGDAGYHRDPITGHGITDALRDAELLADAVTAVLRDGADERTALTTYERERDRALTETFRITRELGAFPPLARFVQLQRELSSALEYEAQVLASRPRRATDVPVA
jgi:flavin-dependent dehydrogenase